MEVGVSLGLALVAYNNIANLSDRFQKTSVYVIANSLVASLTVLAGSRLGGLSLAEIGLTLPQFRHFALAAVISAMALVPLALVGRLSPAAVDDRRLWQASRGDVVVRAVLRVPVGTALLEEIAFRGVIFGWFFELGEPAAVLASSVLFGLWHITPTIDLVAANRPDLSRAPFLFAAALGGVVVTAVAGAGFALLRVTSGSVWPGFVVHWLVNSGATVIAYASHRRSRRHMR